MAWAEIMAELHLAVNKRDAERQIESIDTTKAGKTGGKKYGDEFTATASASLAGLIRRFGADASRQSGTAGGDSGRAFQAGFATSVRDLQATIASVLSRAGAARAKLDVDDTAAQSRIAMIQAQLLELGKRVVSPRIDVAGLAGAEAKILALDATLRAAGDRVGGDAGRSAGNRFVSLFGDTVKVGLSSSSLLAGIGPGILGISAKWLLIGTGLETAIAGLPALIGTALAGVQAGIAGAFAAIGGYALIGTKNAQGQLYAAAQNVADVFKTELGKAAQGMAGPLSQALAQLPALITSITPALRQAFAGAGTMIQPLLVSLTAMARNVLPLLGDSFAAAAPLIAPVISGLDALATTSLPAVTRMLSASGPVVQAFAGTLRQVGDGIAGMLDQFTAALPASTAVMTALGSIAATLLPVIGNLAATFANTLAPAVSGFAGIFAGLQPVFAAVAQLAADVGKAVVIDLNAALRALGDVFTMINPALSAFITALGGIFTTLENTGVFADLGNTIEKMAAPLGAFINQLLTGLTPLLPPIISFLTQVTEILATGLASALTAVLPPLTQLATVTLAALAQILPAVLPAITALLGAFTGAAAGAIAGIAKALAAIISAVPPGVLTGIAAAVLAFAGAIKAIHLASAAAGAITTIVGALRLLATLGVGLAIQQVSINLAQLGTQVARLASSPWTWVAIAAAALGVLIYNLATAKTAVQQYFAELAKTAQAAPILQLHATLAAQLAGAQNDVARSSAAVAAANAHYEEVLRATAGTQMGNVAALTQANQAYHEAQAVQSGYAAGLAQIKGEQQIVNQHIAQAAAIFGGTTQAWAALSAAGVTSDQVLDKNAGSWSATLIKAEAFDKGLRDNLDTQGRYQAAMNATAQVTGSTGSKFSQLYSEVSKATQAQTQLLGILLGGEQAFISYQQGIAAIGQQAQSAGGKVGGLDAASLTLSGDFYQTVLPGLAQLGASLANMGASSGQLRNALATGASEALRFAGSNDTARAMVVALINNALGPGTVSLQSLNTWVGQNKTTMDGFNSIVGNVTVNASKLAGVLQGQLNVMMANAAILAQGGQAAFNQFAQGVNAGNLSAQQLYNGGGAQVLSMLMRMSNNDVPRAKAAFTDWAINGLGKSASEAQNLWNTLVRERLTAAAGQADMSRGKFFALAGQFGLTRDAAQRLWDTINRQPGAKTVGIHMRGDGSFIITQSGKQGNATGGLITGPGGPTSDTAGLFALSNGEWVMRAAATAHYGLAAMAAVNEGRAVIGYAAGGPAGHAAAGPAGPATIIRGMSTGGYVGDFAGLAGFTAGMYAAFETEFTAAMVAAMQAAMKQAIETTKAAMAGGALGAAGPAGTGGSQSANVALGKQMAAARGWTGAEWDALYALWMGESGWNANAVNASSGAAGIPQALGHGNVFALGDAAAQIAWGLDYIASVYGDPVNAYNAWLSRSPHWYDRGGKIREPVVGIGQYSQALYGFGGTGSEWVIPDAMMRTPMRPDSDMGALAGRLDQLIAAVRAVPAATGRHVGDRIDNGAAAAAFRARYPAGGI